MNALKAVISCVALLTSLTGTAGIANAGLINEWSFSVNNTWDPATTVWTPTGTGPTNNFGSGGTLPDGADPRGDYSYLQWGSPATPGGSRSFLGADNNYTRTGLFTNDLTGVAGSNFYHGNYVQYEPSNTREKWLLATTLISEITITPVDPAGAGIAVTRTFEIDFKETLNTGGIAGCEGYPWGGVPPSTMPCPDKFTIDTTQLVFETDVIDGYIYTFVVSFDPASFENVAGITDNGDSTVTIWTHEQILSKLGTRVVVTARVPEPGMVGIAGLGLAAIGFGLRRRRK